MDATFDPNSTSSAHADQYLLLTERMESHNEREHIINISRNDDASSTSSRNGQPAEIDLLQHEDSSSSLQGPTPRASSSSLDRLNSGNSAHARRGDEYDHQRRSPLNSGLWISIELLVTVGQIIASIVVLSLSRNEKPQAPLFVWVVGYASGCVATLPVLYWRFRNRNQSVLQDSVQSHQGSSQNNSHDSPSYTAISVTQASEEDNFRSDLAATNGHNTRSLSSRLHGFMEHFKMALDCFFAVWFVVGNVWIFGGHSSPTDAPKLYKLCIVFLTFSCIGYAMPFILCATICCCLPCIISLLSFREEFSQTRGASAESINNLPTYKFKLRKTECVNSNDSMVTGEGGVLAAGTEKELSISEEDAVCCICLNKYADNDELRELPCCHVFHVDCVDKWLKINASCPLCKSELGGSSSARLPDEDPSQH